MQKTCLAFKGYKSADFDNVGNLGLLEKFPGIFVKFGSAPTESHRFRQDIEPKPHTFGFFPSSASDKSVDAFLADGAFFRCAAGMFHALVTLDGHHTRASPTPVPVPAFSGRVGVKRISCSE